MILYHGTSFDKGRSILRDGIIKVNVESVYDDCSVATTKGFIYLTDLISKAIYYACNTLLLTHDKLTCDLKSKINSICLFKLDVDESLLQVDIDEYRYTRMYNSEQIPNEFHKSLKEVHSVRIGKAIKLTEDCLSYCILPSYDLDFIDFRLDKKLEYSKEKQERLVNLSELVKKMNVDGTGSNINREPRVKDLSFINWINI